MKRLIALFVILLPAVMVGQTQPAQIFAAGVSYNQGASPSLAGTALYAHSVDQSGTYAFTVFDAVPASVKPFRVTTNVGVGVAQKLFTVSKVDFYSPNALGVSWTGQNSGWQWSTGLAASVHIKGGWYAFPTARVIKSSVNDGSGLQFIPTILFGRKQ